MRWKLGLLILLRVQNCSHVCSHVLIPAVMGHDRRGPVSRIPIGVVVSGWAMSQPTGPLV
jgi:hypothetical protein